MAQPEFHPGCVPLHDNQVTACMQEYAPKHLGPCQQRTAPAGDSVPAHSPNQKGVHASSVQSGCLEVLTTAGPHELPLPGSAVRVKTATCAKYVKTHFLDLDAELQSMAPYLSPKTERRTCGASGSAPPSKTECPRPELCMRLACNAPR